MTEKEQRAIISRLHRISGQVAGIEKMVSEGAPEEEIIIQINAVKQAAHRVGQMLLNSKVNDCIRFGSPVRRRRKRASKPIRRHWSSIPECDRLVWPK